MGSGGCCTVVLSFLLALFGALHVLGHVPDPLVTAFIGLLSTISKLSQCVRVVCVPAGELVFGLSIAQLVIGTCHLSQPTF
jgi:hypothetical protein